MNGTGVKIKLLGSTSVEKDGHEEEIVQEQDIDAGVEQHVEVEEEIMDFAQGESEKSGDASDGTNSSDDNDSEYDSDTDSTSSSESEVLSETTSLQDRQHVSAIQDAQSSPDGTCIITTDYDRNFSVYIIDQDILETPTPRNLTPYAQFTSPDPIHSFAVNPFFTLQDPQTTQVLVSKRNQYITLHNAIWDLSSIPQTPSQSQAPKYTPIDISTKLASYKLIDHLTEEVLAPLSLTYTSDGTHFIAGTANQISIFDLSYTDDPVTRIRTIPSTRSKLKDGGRGFKGSISSLTVSPVSGILAAGTRSRYVGLYDSEGSGEQITHFPLPGTVNRNKVKSDNLEGLIGNGVTQLKWSPCAKYLYVAERNSDALLIYDVRNFSFNLGHCVGRNALTKQKLGFDIWDAADAREDGHEVWAGGVDGCVRVWRNPHLREGAVEADEVLGVGEEPVSSTLVHPCGSLAITAKGSRSDVEGGKGRVRGGGMRPRFRDWGCLDIFGLVSYQGSEHGR